MDAADPKTRYTEAKRLFRSGKCAESLDLLRRLDAEIPGIKHILLAQAECFVALGDRDAARDVCEQILAQEEDARARRILARCDSGPPPLPPAPAPSSALKAPPLPLYEPHKSHVRLVIAIAAVIIVAGGVTFIAERRTTRADLPGVRPAKAIVPEEVPAASEDPVADYAKILQEGKDRRDTTARETEAKRAAAADAASKRPGYEIPPEEWNLDPETGVPAWRPGIYRKLPCKDSWFELEKAPRTIDVYIPMAYAEKPEELFPVLSITMPGRNLGFRGYEKWAERREVILIVINSSYNDGGISNNREAQLAAYNFLIGKIRAHPQLNFATGSSGGAQMGWIAAANSPDMFSGILMCSHGGYRELYLPPKIRVAYVNGNEDWNADYIVEMMAKLRANGNEVRHQVVQGGHIEGPLEVRTQMLDWLLDSGRHDLEANPAEPPAD